MRRLLLPRQIPGDTTNLPVERQEPLVLPGSQRITGLSPPINLSAVADLMNHNGLLVIKDLV